MSGQAWLTISEAVSRATARGIEVGAAKAGIADAVRAGRISTRNTGGATPGGELDVPVLNPGMDYPGLIGDGGSRSPEHVSAADMDAWLTDILGEGAGLEAETRGRKVRIDWDAFWIAVCLELHEGGRAETQAEFLRRVDDRLSRLPDRAKPGKTEAEARISALYKALATLPR